MKIIKILVFLIIIFCLLKCTKPIFTKKNKYNYNTSFFEKFAGSQNDKYKNFKYGIISIHHTCDYYISDEINIIYPCCIERINDSTLFSSVKIHSIKKINFNKEMDTCFILNGKQNNKIERFVENIIRGTVPKTNEIIAGSNTTCKIIIGDEILEKEFKTETSLIDSLIN